MLLKNTEKKKKDEALIASQKGAMNKFIKIDKKLK